MTRLKKYALAFSVFVFCIMAGCAPRQRIVLELDQYLAHPEAYKQYDVIISARVNDILERYDDYRNKRVQVTAPFEYFGHYGFWTWHIMLNDNGNRLRCYSHHYRISAEWDAKNLLMRARAAGKPITVNGLLYRDGIDILEITYDDQIVRPHVKPVRVYPWLWHYPFW
ncbi:MAG: hypothetical protein N3B18_00085 [Desulfobacterota bacterium]|nr:hypothetical protein [Thermodesulfobacteriota bacterium]